MSDVGEVMESGLDSVEQRLSLSADVSSLFSSSPSLSRLSGWFDLDVAFDARLADI